MRHRIQARYVRRDSETFVAEGPTFSRSSSAASFSASPSAFNVGGGWLVSIDPISPCD